MAAAETAKLIASLALDDRGFTKGVQNATGNLGKLETRFGKLGGLAAQGMRNAGANIARAGAVAAGAITLAVKSGLDDLAELESAVTSVDGAIAQLGLTGKLTGQQVAAWANEIEAATGAAFDDKAITRAATSLIRYGKITPANLRPALVVMTDLAAKTGDVDSAATLLAKALADPEKAAGKLARSGVILTKQQQEQIKAMVKAGQTAEAQAFLLDQLAKATGGAALASQGPYKRAMSVLADVSEDAKKALAEGFLPVLQRVAKVLSEKLADPRTIESIRSFGQTLAGAFDKLLVSAAQIPWGTIGDSLQVAGMGAKALLDAFTSLPPWVQTAVLTGWGLNKLTGGAIGGIVSELGKGLVKGVLGMNAGVVNINAAMVKAPGVPGVVPNAAGGIAGALASVGGVAGLTAILAIAAPLVAVAAFAAWSGLDKFPNGQQNRPGGSLGVDPTRKSPKDRRTDEEFAAAVKELDMAAKALQKPLPSSGDPRLRPGALDAKIHASLDALINQQGGSFLRAGEKAKTLDENAGKLVDLFRTSTNPSLRSMQDNMAILKGLAAQGDPKTRAALSDDIKALQDLINRKLTDVEAAVRARAAFSTPGRVEQREAWGGAGATRPISVTATVTARDVTHAQQIRNRTGPMVAQ